MRVLVFNIIWDNLVSPGDSVTCIYILVIDRTYSSLYEVRCSIKKHLTPNLICYIIQKRIFARKVPDKLLRSINNLFSINFGTNEVISIVKKKLIPLFTKSMQRVGYIYEMDI